MPWGDAETFKSFNLIHYLQPFFLFIVINALLVSGIYTAIAVITAKPGFGLCQRGWVIGILSCWERHCGGAPR